MRHVTPDHSTRTVQLQGMSHAEGNGRRYDGRRRSGTCGGKGEGHNNNGVSHAATMYSGATLQAIPSDSLRKAVTAWAESAIPSDALYHRPEKPNKTYGRVPHLHATIAYFPLEAWSAWLKGAVAEEAAAKNAAAINSSTTPSTDDVTTTANLPTIPENWTGAAAFPRGQPGDRTATARGVAVWEEEYFDLIVLRLDPAPLMCRIYSRVFDRNPYGLDKTNTPGWYEGTDPHITIAYVNKGRGKRILAESPLEGDGMRTCVKGGTAPDNLGIFNGITWEIQALELSRPTGEVESVALPPLDVQPRLVSCVVKETNESLPIGASSPGRSKWVKRKEMLGD